MSKILRLAKNAFTNYPIVTNAVVYGTLYVGAEFSQQTLTRKFMTQAPQPLDTVGITRYAAYGTFLQGPILTPKEPAIAYDPLALSRYGMLGVMVYPPVYYYWYRWLDKNFVGTSLKIVARKLLLDQFLLTPPLLVLFFVSMSIMENRKDILEECQKKIVPTFKTSCMFWLPAQAVNFLIIPPTYRVAYVGTCAFAWVNILCWIKRQEY